MYTMITARLILISPTSANRLRKAFWLALLIAHVPALLRRGVQFLAGSIDDFSPAAFVTLALVCTFFVFKIFDLPCLRFRTDRRSLLALTLAAALMHWNVLPQSRGIMLENHQHVVISQVLLAGTLVSVRSMVARFVRWMGRIPAALLAPVLRRQRIAPADRFLGLATVPVSPRAPRAPPILL